MEGLNDVGDAEEGEEWYREDAEAEAMGDAVEEGTGDELFKVEEEG